MCKDLCFEAAIKDGEENLFLLRHKVLYYDCYLGQCRNLYDEVYHFLWHVTLKNISS